MSTAYHPQTNGRGLPQGFLRYAGRLGLNTVHSSTGQTTSFVVTGKHPRWNDMHEAVQHEGEAVAGVKRLQA